MYILELNVGLASYIEILPEVKPDEEMLPKVRPDEEVLLKPCDTVSQSSTGMFLKPCDSVSENITTKKRRVDTLDVDNMSLDEELPPIKIKEGQPLDITALLSSKHRDYLVSPKEGDARVPISTLHGNHVLVCGFSLPVHARSRVASEFRAIQALYSDLSRRGIADHFKLVIVVNRCAGFSEADWRTLFSRIPVNCLTVPLSDSRSLDFLRISLCYAAPSHVALPHLVVNPSGVVLKHCPDFLIDYGPLSFPFTEEHCNICYKEDQILENQLYFSYEPITVKRLLGCEKLSEIGNELKSKSTVELDNTTVGIYLYIGGEFMDKLQDIHQKCVEKGLKFEIVLVPLPFHTESDPVSFYELMKQHALKYSTSSTWLTFPFDDKICRTLWRIFRGRTKDQLIILQHDNWHGELFGKQVASYYGIDAYPFNREVVVESKFSELRSLTTDSLFYYMDDVPKKNVLLHIDYLGHGCSYTELMAKCPADIVDIFIPIGSYIREPISFDEEGEFEVKDLLFMKGTYFEEPVRPLIVVFGEDGEIVSRHEDGELRGWTTPANLFDDTLLAEIIYDVRSQIEAFPR